VTFLVTDLGRATRRHPSVGGCGPRTFRPRRTSRSRSILSACSLIAVVAFIAAACSRREPQPVEQVARRLGPEAFGLTNSPYHGEVAQIGDDARPVVVAPARHPVALGLGLLAQGGAVRLETPLDDELRDLGAGSFVVAMQRFPMPMRLPDSAFADFARTLFARKLERDWRLERAKDGHRATLVYTPPAHELADPIGDVYFNLRLEALLPPPSHLESLPFELPESGHLELGFGLLNPEGAEDVAPVRFAARLDCGGATTELLGETIDPATTASRGWHDRRFALPKPAGKPCRLLLSAEAAQGDAPVRSAVWTVPRVLEVDRGDDRNLLLVSLDTLRADHLSGYGYARPTSPRIDRELIERGTQFNDVSSTFPQTDAAHLSLFTGLYAGAQPGRGRLGAASPVPLLTERLRDAGFETAAFTEDALIAGSFGFWFGFDRFVERSFRERERGHETFADGMRYLREHRDRRFFLFLHTYKTHDPYVAGDRYQGLFADPAEWEGKGPAAHVPPRHRAKVDAYDRTIREADDLMGDLLAELEGLGLAERTVVVLLSDHGESFGEHGATGHGFSGFREQLWVPLVLRGPDVPEGLEIDAPASLVDVAPTLLDLLGVEPLPLAQGKSLAPALRGEDLGADRPLFFAWLQDGAAGVRLGERKYVRSNLESEPRVFDIVRDPEERAPLPAPGEFRPLAEKLVSEQRAESERLRATLSHGTPSPGEPALSEHMERSLRALGYIE
jgi:arylsulfatase A-like enzyme